jgi:peptide/nickel transport system substrate-binding protein
MVSRRKLAVGLGVVAVAAISLLAASWAGAQGKAASLPRSQTLITSGTQWGNISGFNPYAGSYAAGMVGLVNETLIRYDPLADKYIPWLAKSAGFVGTKYVIQVRTGVKWSNGQTFKPSDVVFNINLGRFTTAPWHVLWTNIKNIAVKGNTITVTFKSTPNYIQWQNMMWAGAVSFPMVNPTQFANVNNTTLTTIGGAAGYVPIGTGPYVLDTAAYDPSSRVVWQKRSDSWWAAAQGVAPEPAPTYIEDLCNTSNTNALSGLLTKLEDLNNNYLPGIQQLVANHQAQTYFSKTPYDLSANTAWLELNTTHTPLNDPNFRRAMAEAVSRSQIVESDYGDLVLPANQTGLLNIWDKWVDQKQLKKLGFKHSVADAKAILAANGYKDVNGDGYVENKDGSKLALNIEVPSGWSDWEIARAIIVSNEKAAGIHLVVKVGDQNAVQFVDRNLGKFDTEVDNFYQISDNPWAYYNGIFHLPIITTGTGQTFANFGRYNNLTGWKLTQQLDKTPPTDTAGRAAIMSKLQKITLTQLPIIPLWYNGIWAQTQSAYWTNWPSDSSGRHYIPCMWRGYLNMTGIDTITHIKAA